MNDTTRNTTRLATCPAASSGNVMSELGSLMAPITPSTPCWASSTTTPTATLATMSITTASTMASNPCHHSSRVRGGASGGKPGGSGKGSSTASGGVRSGTGCVRGSTYPTRSGRFSPSSSFAKLS